MRSLFIVVLLGATTLSMGTVDVENPVCEKFMLGGYIDARYSEYGQYNVIPSREFTIRRSGLEVCGAFTDNLSAELKVELRPDQVFLKNALVEWNPLDFASGRFGQFRRASLLGGDLSSWKLPLMDRPLVYDLRENLTYGGRDLGFDVEVTLPVGDFLDLQGTAGVFNGEERGIQREDNELLYSFRGTADFPKAGITLGGSAVMHRLGIVNQAVPEGYTSSGRLAAFSADLSFEHKFSNWYSAELFAEFTTGDNWMECDVLSGEDPPAFTGMWGALSAFYHPWNIDPVRSVGITVGYDKVTENTDFDLYQKQISVIASIYFTENTRIRFGGVRNTVEELLFSDEYTDLTVEAGFRF